jgi:type IV secretion system protein VirB9
MADYFSQTVIRPDIPRTAMTELEWRVLRDMFEHEEVGEDIYFFASHGPNDFVFLEIAEVRRLLEESDGIASSVADLVRKEIGTCDPDAAELELDMSVIGFEGVINTDRRTYHVELRATAATYMASVSWTYPADELIALQAAEADAARAAPVAGGIDLAALNFRYRIAGDKVAWRPVRAFDDTRQLFIEFGEGVETGDMPPLFVIGGSGEAELVNYRVQGRYMIVDRLFERGELRLGAGKQARVVRIEREMPRRRGRS